MKLKKIFVMPLILSMGLGVLAGCDNLAPTDKPNNTPPNSQVEPDIKPEDKPSTPEGKPEEQIITKNYAVNTINDFNSDYLRSKVASEEGVSVKDVNIENPEWKTNIKTDESGKMTVEVSLTVKLEDGTTKTYICIVDLSNIKEELEIKISGPDKIIIGSKENVKVNDLIKNFLVTDMKGKDIEADLSIHNSENLDLTKAGTYEIIVRAVEKTTKIGAVKNVTLIIEEQYTVKFVNGGKVLSEYILNKGESVSYKGEVPTKEADMLYRYEFIGWDIEATNVREDLEVKAKFKAIKTHNKITFLLPNGESLNNDIYLPVGKKFSGLEMPNLKDKVFKGYFTDEKLTKPYDFNTEVTDNLVLYAKYNDLVNVTVSILGLNEEQTIIKKVEVGTKLNDLLEQIKNEISETNNNIKHYELAIKHNNGENETVSHNLTTITFSYVPKNYNIEVKGTTYYSNAIDKYKTKTKFATKNLTIDIKNYMSNLEKLARENNAGNYLFKYRDSKGTYFETIIDFEELLVSDHIVIEYQAPEKTLNIYNQNSFVTVKTNLGLTFRETLEANSDFSLSEKHLTERNNYRIKTYQIECSKWLSHKTLEIEVSEYLNSDTNYNSLNSQTFITVTKGETLIKENTTMTYQEFVEALESTGYTIQRRIVRDELNYNVGNNYDTYQLCGFSPNTLDDVFESYNQSYLKIYDVINKNTPETIHTIYKIRKRIYVDYQDEINRRIVDYLDFYTTRNVSDFNYSHINAQKLYDHINYRFRKTSFLSNYNGLMRKVLNEKQFYENILKKDFRRMAGFFFDNDYTNVSYNITIQKDDGTNLKFTKKYGEKYTFDELVGLIGVDKTKYNIDFFRDKDKTDKILPFWGNYNFPYQNATLYYTITLKETVEGGGTGSGTSGSNGSNSGTGNGNSSDGTSSGTSGSTGTGSGNSFEGESDGTSSGSSSNRPVVGPDYTRPNYTVPEYTGKN